MATVPSHTALPGHEAPMRNRELHAVSNGVDAVQLEESVNCRDEAGLSLAAMRSTLCNSKKVFIAEMSQGCNDFAPMVPCSPIHAMLLLSPPLG